MMKRLIVGVLVRLIVQVCILIAVFQLTLITLDQAIWNKTRKWDLALFDPFITESI